jgi:transcriptional regulator with XRE-family HTH domain
MQPMERIGANIRADREARGLSRDALAARCRLNSNEVTDFETGESDPGSEGLIKIAAVLRVTPTSLYRGVYWNQNSLRLLVEPLR